MGLFVLAGTVYIGRLLSFGCVLGSVPGPDGVRWHVPPRVEVMSRHLGSIRTSQAQRGCWRYALCLPHFVLLKNKQNRCDFKTELELLSQRNRLACLRPQTFGMLKRDKITFGLGLIAALDLKQVF